MKLLNTVPLANSLIAHSLNAIAVYDGGVIKVYTKNSSTNGLDLQSTTYAIADVRELHISENGQYIAAQTDTQIIRCANGVQTPFTANGKYAISDTGLIIHLSYSTGAAQLITDSTTNITVTLSSNDRVVCGKSKYIIYSATRYLTAAYSDVTYVTTTPSVSILHIFHCGNDKFAIFFSDGTASFAGLTRVVAVLPKMGFRKFGKFLAFTDYRNEYVNSLDGPISDGTFMRKFVRDLPLVADKVSWAKVLLSMTGASIATDTMDVKNKLAPTQTVNVTIASDSPYGNTGKSFSFNGSSILQTADSSNVQLAGNDFTIEMFVKVTAISDVAATILNKGGVAYLTNSSYQLFVTKASNTFNFVGTTIASSYDVGNVEWGSWEYDVWTHVAISRQGNNWRCFQDGILKATFTKSGSLVPISGQGLTVGSLRRDNWSTGALFYPMAGQVNGLMIHNYAKYTANFFVETLPLIGIEAPVVTPPASGPGPTTLKAGNKQLGYYGQVSNAVMQGSDNLPALAGLSSAGTPINTSTVWLKFAYQNKVVYIPKQPILNTVTWDAIYAAGAVFGVDDIGYAPGSPTVKQKKVVTFNASKYIVRLPQGADAEVSTSTAYFTQNPSGVQNSEWNNLMGRVWESDPTGTYWERFTATEMSATIGAFNSAVWGQESLSANSAWRIIRNHPPLLGYTGGITAQAQQSANLNGVWWPVLEWQNPKTPDFNLIDGTTLPAGATNTNVVVTNNNLKFNGAGSFLNMPDQPSLAFGTGDFEITMEMTFDAIVSNPNGNITTLLNWGTYAQPNQPYNLDIYYYHNGNSFVFASNIAFDSNMTKSFTYAITLGKPYKISFVRENGVLFVYINGRQVYTVAYAYDMQYKGVGPISVGRRRGGSQGEVNWDSNMTVRSLVIRK